MIEEEHGCFQSINRSVECFCGYIVELMWHGMKSTARAQSVPHTGDDGTGLNGHGSDVGSGKSHCVEKREKIPLR